MYDFNNGRFLSVDPFIQGDTSQAINPYSYIHNNPLSGTDPTGYLPCKDGVGNQCETPKPPKRKKKNYRGTGAGGSIVLFQRSNGKQENKTVGTKESKGNSDIGNYLNKRNTNVEYYSCNAPISCQYAANEFLNQLDLQAGDKFLEGFETLTHANMFAAVYYGQASFDARREVNWLGYEDLADDEYGFTYPGVGESGKKITSQPGRIHENFNKFYSTNNNFKVRSLCKLPLKRDNLKV